MSTLYAQEVREAYEQAQQVEREKDDAHKDAAKREREQEEEIRRWRDKESVWRAEREAGERALAQAKTDREAQRMREQEGARQSERKLAQMQADLASREAALKVPPKAFIFALLLLLAGRCSVHVSTGR